MMIFFFGNWGNMFSVGWWSIVKEIILIHFVITVSVQQTTNLCVYFLSYLVHGSSLSLVSSTSSIYSTVSIMKFKPSIRML